MQLETERLILRSFREDDVDSMAQLLANPDFMRSHWAFLPSANRPLLSSRKSWAGIAPASRRSLPSSPRSEDAILGYCGFFYHPEHGIEDIEIGYRLHPDHWNRGLITEAARAVCDHGFRDWKLSRVYLALPSKNIPSRHVAEKNGMKVEKKITFRGFPTLVYAINSAGVAGEVWRSMNSRARAR